MENAPVAVKLVDMGEKQYFISDLEKLLGVPRSWIMNLYCKRGEGRGLPLFRPYFRSTDPKIPHRFSDSDVEALKSFFTIKKAYLEAIELLKTVNRK